MSTIIYLLQVTACTAVFYLFYFLFLSRLTFFTTNRWYLLVTILLSFLIPWLRITLNEQQPYVAAVQHMIYVPQTMPTTQETQVIVQQAPVAAEPIHWDAILRMAYFAMAAALGVHLLITLLSFLKHIKGKRIAKIGKVNVLSGQQKIANGSFLNYIFLNEDELSPDEIAQIIAHEMLHIKLYHSLDRILVKIAQIILWFNPFIYLYARSVEENHEFEVDREIARSTDKHNYANLLLHLSVAGQGMLYHNFSKVPLKKRISMLFNKPSNKMKRITYVLIVPVVLISCLAFAKLKKADVNNIDSTQIVYKQKIKRTREEAMHYKKQQDAFKKYQQTDNYKNKMKLMDDIAGKIINVTVKGTIPNKIYPNKQGAILAVYNGHEFAIDSRYGQGKTLFNMLKPGDQITLKVFESVVGPNYPVTITPAYVIKNKVKIFQLAEANKIPDYPFLYEANKVRFAEGQISNIVKYPNGKWRSALFETVNGYKFSLNFKPSAPDLNSIEDGDHVRLRFVHEVKTGAKTYRINDWVSITTNIKDYGIKNPELFSRFYTEVKTAPALKSGAVGTPSVSVNNSLTNQKIKILNESISRKKKIKVLNESIKHEIEKQRLEAKKKSKVINQQAKNNLPVDQYYKRRHFVKNDGTYYDQIEISMPQPYGLVVHEISPSDKLGFVIDQKIYNEEEFKKVLPSVVNSLSSKGSGIGPANNNFLNHGLNASNYNIIISFNTRKPGDPKDIVLSAALKEVLEKIHAFETENGKELPERQNDSDKINPKSKDTINKSGHANQNNTNTVEFATKRYNLPVRAVLSQLLNMLPNIKVDNDGSVSYNGASVTHFTINNYEYKEGDIKHAVQHVAAFQIDSVQVSYSSSKSSVNTLNVHVKSDQVEKHSAGYPQRGNATEFVYTAYNDISFLPGKLPIPDHLGM